MLWGKKYFTGIEKLMTQCKDKTTKNWLSLLIMYYFQICNYHYTLSMNLICERKASIVNMSFGSGNRLPKSGWHL